jgi:hypothetical protein
MTPRAGVVEVGRRNEVEARSAFPYPHLDGAEHGVRLRAARGAEDAGVSVTGRRLSIPLLRYPIAEHLLLYGVGGKPPPDGVR